MTGFDTLGLGVELLHSIEYAGFKEPTAVQARAIPLLLQGGDLMGTAQTGEGKTAAYLLPMLHRLAEKGEKPIPRKPRVLILAPTRELAGQIGDALRQFTKGLRLYYTVIYGGTPFLTQRQVLERGVHILIATPGRLMDHLRRGTMTLDQVDSFVLDEADRMLDMGFVDEVKEVAASLPPEHQTVMFSATMNRGVRGLASALLRNPGLIEIGRENAVAANVDHRVMRVKYPDKKSLLLHLLARPEVSRVLVFSRTKAMADTLVRDVRDAGLSASAIHGDLEQSMRQKVLRNFRAGQVNILVATDVAARGIDVPDITHVINYDMPLEAEAYIHRVGRTGRAGAKGVALSICDANEGHLLRNIEQLIGIKVPVDAEHPFHDDRPVASRGLRPGNGARPKRPFNKSAPHRAEASQHRVAGPPRRDAAPRREATSYRDAARGDNAAPARRPDSGATIRPARPEGTYKQDGTPKAGAPFITTVPYKAKPRYTQRTDAPARRDEGRRDEGSSSRPGEAPRFAAKPSKRPPFEAGGRRDRPAHRDRPAKHDQPAKAAGPAPRRRGWAGTA